MRGLLGRVILVGIATLALTLATGGLIDIARPYVPQSSTFFGSIVHFGNRWDPAAEVPYWIATIIAFIAGNGVFIVRQAGSLRAELTAPQADVRGGLRVPLPTMRILGLNLVLSASVLIGYFLLARR